jgi:hypothetical protein
MIAPFLQMLLIFLPAGWVHLEKPFNSNCIPNVGIPPCLATVSNILLTSRILLPVYETMSNHKREIDWLYTAG